MLSDIDTNFLKSAVSEPIELLIDHAFAQKVRKKEAGNRLVALYPSNLHIIKVDGDARFLRQTIHLSTLTALITDTPDEPLSERVHKEAANGPRGHGIMICLKDGYWNRMLFEPDDQIRFVSEMLRAHLRLLPPGGKKAVIRGPVEFPSDITSFIPGGDAPANLFTRNYSASLTDTDRNFLSSAIEEPVDHVICSAIVDKVKKKSQGDRLLFLTSSSLFICKINGNSRTLRQSIPFSSLSIVSIDTPHRPLPESVHREASDGPLGFGLLVVTRDGYWNRFLFDEKDHFVFTCRFVYYYNKIMPPNATSLALIHGHSDEVVTSSTPAVDISDTAVEMSFDLSDLDKDFIRQECPETLDTIKAYCKATKVRKKPEGDRLLLLTPFRIYAIKVQGDGRWIRQSIHLSQLSLIASDTPVDPCCETLHSEASEGPVGHGLLIAMKDGYWIRFLIDETDHEVFVSSLITAYYTMVPQPARKCTIRGPIKPKVVPANVNSNFQLSNIANLLLVDDCGASWRDYRLVSVLQTLLKDCSDLHGLGSRQLHPLCFSNSLVPTLDPVITDLIAGIPYLFNIDVLDVDFAMSFENLSPHDIELNYQNKNLPNTKRKRSLLLQSLTNLFHSAQPPRVIKLSNIVFELNEISWIPPTVPAPRNFEKIKHFELNSVGLPSNGLNELLLDLCSSKHLEVLTLRDLNLASCFSAFLQLLSSSYLKSTLKYLDISYNQLNQRQSQDLAGVLNTLIYLEGLNLSFTDFHVALIIPLLPTIKNLKHLSLNGVMFKSKRVAAFVQSISRCQLTSLSIANCGFSERDVLLLLPHVIASYKPKKPAPITLSFGATGFSNSFMLFLESNLPLKLADVPVNLRLNFAHQKISLGDFSSLMGSFSRLNLESLTISNLPVHRFLVNDRSSLTCLNQLRTPKFYLHVTKETTRDQRLRLIKQLLSLRCTFEVLNLCSHFPIDQEVIDLLASQISSEKLCSFIMPPINCSIGEVSLAGLKSAIEETPSFLFCSPVFVSNTLHEPSFGVSADITEICLDRLRINGKPFYSLTQYNPLYFTSHIKPISQKKEGSKKKDDPRTARRRQLAEAAPDTVPSSLIERCAKIIDKSGKIVDANQAAPVKEMILHLNGVERVNLAKELEKVIGEICNVPGLQSLLAGCFRDLRAIHDKVSGAFAK
ncbi:hypothetical protein P9112_000248 [Eukaryota sp. TZLM1-RC]